MFSAPGAALIRAATYPQDLALPAWPDPDCDRPQLLLEWLGEVWQLPGFAAAVTVASPQLARQVQRALTGKPLSLSRLRRLVETLIRYLLRWTTRATPFGQFAGIAPAKFGPHAVVHCSKKHRKTLRPNADFIAEHITRAEQDPKNMHSIRVVVNPLGFLRGDYWMLPYAHVIGDHRWDAQIRLTSPVRKVIQAATRPIRFTDLVVLITGKGQAKDDKAEQLLIGMLRQGMLLSQVRPPMIVTDPVSHLTQYTTLPEMDGRTVVDVRVDVQVTLPPAVLAEANRAAQALVAVAPGFPGWAEYHSAFIDRWGPGAAVPVREVIRVLGFPAGFRGSTRRYPTNFTARDRLLLGLAQQCAMEATGQVNLDNDLLSRLRGGDRRAPVPHTELRFTLAAETPSDLEHGSFTLTVASGSRHAGVTAARFLHLLTPEELRTFQEVYQSLPTTMAGAELVQLACPPMDANLATVARAPELLPVLPLGDFHPNPPLELKDLSVTGDGQRLWLISNRTGRPVEPLLFNCVLPDLQQPLARFLNEIWTAWVAPCSKFDWGYAANLPYLPRVRRGRSILCPARWIIDRCALPARNAPWNQWCDAWREYQTKHRIPCQVLLGDMDVQLRLKLDMPAELRILRQHLDRGHRTVLTEAPGYAGWIDNRPTEVLLTITSTTTQAPPSRRPIQASLLCYPPGDLEWLEAHVVGPTDHILTDLASQDTEPLSAGWWFLRYPNPEPHLRIRIPISDADGLTSTNQWLLRWVRHLDTAGLLGDYTQNTYRPESRHGRGVTLTSAHAVFAADSQATLRRLDGDRQAATSASMIMIIDVFAGDSMNWLTNHVSHYHGFRLQPAQLDLARIPWWDQKLAQALTGYRQRVEQDAMNPNQVLVDLLHLHHARMIGVDQASEQHCLRLARSIAQTQLRKTQ